MNDKGEKVSITSATPAILIVILVFCLPTEWHFWPFNKFGKAEDRRKVQSSRALITWEKVEKNLPWGVILLLSGGFALSDACKVSGRFNLHTLDHQV